MKSSRRKNVLVIGFIALPLLFLLNYLFIQILIGENRLEKFCRPPGHTPFNASIWKTASPISGKLYEMTDDLLASTRLPGLTEPQVTALLGDPNSSNEAEGEMLWVYHSARQRDYPAKSLLFPGIFPNHEAWMLAIHIRNGTVRSAEVFFD